MELRWDRVALNPMSHLRSLDSDQVALLILPFLVSSLSAFQKDTPAIAII